MATKNNPSGDDGDDEVAKKLQALLKRVQITTEKQKEDDTKKFEPAITDINKYK